MKRRRFLQTCAGGALALGADAELSAQSTSAASLEDAFRNPPSTALARTWWHWMNGNISEIGITRDLEAMKRVGVSGFQIFQVGTGIPKGPVDYGSPQHFALLRHAAREAGRLGLEFAMHNCPGWSSSGGPWITPGLSMQSLTWTETFVAGGQKVSVALGRPPARRDYYRDAMVLAVPAGPGEEMRPDMKPLADSPVTFLEFAEPIEARSVTVYWTPDGPLNAPRPGNRFGVLAVSDDGKAYRKLADLEEAPAPGRGGILPYPLTAGFPATRARFFQLAATQPMRVADVRFSAASRIANWAGKASFGRRAGAPATVEAAGGRFIDAASVIDVTRFMNAEGQLDWTAPAGNWVVLRIGHTTTGAINSPGPDGGVGLECDKFSREAYEFHFNQFFGPVMDAIAPLAAKGMAGATIDSYETGLQNWTAKFPEEFLKRRGYDLKPYMPAMFGRVVGSPEISGRFLWDIRKTQAELMQENYYGEFQRQCHKHGMKSFLEPYDPGNFDEMPTGQYADMVMGEFWLGQPNQHSIKLVASVGHVYDKKIIAAESFTGSSKWQEHPYCMKTTGDFMYTQGLNQFVFHRYCHQPHPDARPGMTMGPWGWFFDRTNTWFEKSSGWLKGYVARAQSMLRQGVFVADILYFTGEDSPQVAPTLAQLDPPPPAGYDWDTIDAEAIQTRVKIEDGRISLPGGQTYSVLVLPPRKKISLALLRKIRDLVHDGMKLVVTARPEETPGLTEYPNCDAEVKRIVSEVWGDLDGQHVQDRAFGKGRVFWGGLDAVLRDLGLEPDFFAFDPAGGHAPIHWIHRRVGEADVYFIANRRRQAVELMCGFRTSRRQPEFWDAVTGETVKTPFLRSTGNRTGVGLRLEAAGSIFVVFRSGATARLDAVIAEGALKRMPADGKAGPAQQPSLVTDNFAISLWVKPEMEMSIPQAGGGPGAGAASGMINPTFALYPPAGEKYGANHSACGLAVARNGLALYERTTGNPIPVLVARVPLAGWTHVAVVYRDGTPSLYAGGKRVVEGKKSERSVHPGLDGSPDAPMDFMGQMTSPEFIQDAADDVRIQQLAAAGLPDPEEPPAFEPSAGTKSGLLFWQDGEYSLIRIDKLFTPLRVSGIGAPILIPGPWTVTFPPNLGAPPRIVLPELKSLHRHSLDGVKYFSGTPTYTTRFQVAADATANGKRLYLDLGRVEVIADVRVNGQPAGNLWKFPYRTEITALVRPGENALEIEVTNLWPNRLIGDEQQPPEYEYAGVTGGIKAIPDWYAQGKPKPPGPRVAFATWQWYSKDDPLLESGLLGPVKLRTAIRRDVEV
ncbi:MAG TPA: glycosyl hydrolase [Bryobacteraceae bacterium]|nr:glycosyl hydrolase [Bryobacteraceae bacterium]